MSYDIVYLDGIRPSWVEADVVIDEENHTITIKCMAKYDRLGADPQTEIDQFNGMASMGKITNDFPLINMGSKLFASNIFPVKLMIKSMRNAPYIPSQR